jgi:hypothetical protein
MLPLFLQAMEQEKTLPGKEIALFSAVREASFERAKICLDQGANINAADADDNMRTPLMIACTLSRESNELVKLLLARNANTELQDSLGKTAIDLAKTNVYPAALNALLEAKAKVEGRQAPNGQIRFPWYYYLPDWMFWIFYKINPKNGG